MPERTFSSRIRVTSYATPGGIARVRCGRPQRVSVSSLPLERITFRIAIGFEYMPPAASVA